MNTALKQRRQRKVTYSCMYLVATTESQMKAIRADAKRREIRVASWMRNAFDAYLNTNPQHQ